jgi:hypothetical protein
MGPEEGSHVQVAEMKLLKGLKKERLCVVMCTVFKYVLSFR